MDLSKLADFEVAGRTAHGDDVLVLTEADSYCLHTYFDTSPWDAEDRRMAHFCTERGSGVGQVRVLDAWTGEVQVLEEVRGFNLHTGAFVQWGPGSERVYYYSAEDGEEKTMRACDSETGEIEVFEGVNNARINEVTAELLYTPDRGETVVVAEPDGSSPTTVARLEQAVALNPRSERFAKMEMRLTHLKWSPTGERLFFLLDDVGEDATGHLVKEIYVVNSDGSDLRWIGKVCRHPAWTPDGKQIILWGDDTDNPTCRRVAVYDVDADEPEYTPISNEPLPSHPSMSPDGRWAVAERSDFEAALVRFHLIDVQTGEDEIIYEERRPNENPDGSRNRTHAHPVWDRAGTTITFNAQPEENSRIFLMPV